MWPALRTTRSRLAIVAMGALVWPYVLLARHLLGTSECYTVRPPEDGSVIDTCSGENCYYGDPIGCTFDLAPWSWTVVPTIAMLVITWAVIAMFAAVQEAGDTFGRLACSAVAAGAAAIAFLSLWDELAAVGLGAFIGAAVATVVLTLYLVARRFATRQPTVPPTAD